LLGKFRAVYVGAIIFPDLSILQLMHNSLGYNIMLSVIAECSEATNLDDSSLTLS